MKATALIIDDEPDILELIVLTLEKLDIVCTTAETVAEAKKALASKIFDICLTDMRLPDGDGFEIVELIQRDYRQIPVAVITAHGSVELAVQALKVGAFDFVSKPVRLRVLRDLVKSALKLAEKDTEAEVTTETSQAADRLLGKTAVMHEVRQKIAKLARSQAPVYISGESGTGKELTARLIHELGARGEMPFIAVNCGAIPAELVESELFGHMKGAFTGASSDKQGLFEAANGGTLLLDEVAELPMSMQVKLLRVLQEKSIRRVGANTEVSIDVRVLSATHHNLAERVKQGQFREDLYYRINVIELPLPSLRERQDDIPMLANYILKNITAAGGEDAEWVISPTAMLALKRYEFPGNIRELENILERAQTWAENQQIEIEDLMLPVPGKKPITQVNEAVGDIAVESDVGTVQSDLASTMESQERELIMNALEETRWNKTAAAKKLGITFRALRYRLKKLDLE